MHWYSRDDKLIGNTSTEIVLQFGESNDPRDSSLPVLLVFFHEDLMLISLGATEQLLPLGGSIFKPLALRHHLCSTLRRSNFRYYPSEIR